MQSTDQKTNKLIISGIGALAVIICFFLDTATESLKLTDGSIANCYFTFTGKWFCYYKGIKVDLSFEDCSGDRFCDTVKSTPVFGGLSLSLGVIAIIAYYVKDQIAEKFTQNQTKWGILIILGGAIIFEVLIPIFYIDNRRMSVKLQTFPLILEFLTLITYCIHQFKKQISKNDSLLTIYNQQSMYTIWVLVLQEKEKEETLFS